MKGIFPTVCRPAGYVLLILSVFIPLLLSMFGLIHEQNLLYVKFSMKLVIWISLFIVFLAKTKDESEETSVQRATAVRFALYAWGICYIILLVKALLNNDINQADGSFGFIFMVFATLCFEFLVKKSRIEKNFRKKQSD